jgi:very-short-patch-repair endonuclease
MAAVLAAGPGAVLSHRAAAALWGVWRWGHGVVEVAAPCQRVAGEGVHVRRSTLPTDEMTFLDGIPVTTVPRTLFDLATVLPRRQLERAIDEAEVRRLTDPLSLDDLVTRYPRRSGVRAIKAILAADRIGATITREELESRFVTFLEEHRLLRPQFNAHLFVADRWIEVDCLWRVERLALELDSRSVHGTRAAFERDRARDRQLQAAGWRTVRVTWRQLHDDPAAVASDLRTLLTALVAA